MRIEKSVVILSSKGISEQRKKFGNERWIREIDIPKIRKQIEFEKKKI